MKRKYAMKWARALESGLFRQAKHSLEDESGYCCLGVLCVVAGDPAIEKVVSGKYYLTGVDLKLQPEVKKQTGFKTPVGYIPYSASKALGSKGRLSLAELNDAYGFTFKQIAKLVRKHWRYL